MPGYSFLKPGLLPSFANRWLTDSHQVQYSDATFVRLSFIEQRNSTSSKSTSTRGRPITPSSWLSDELDEDPANSASFTLASAMRNRSSFPPNFRRSEVPRSPRAYETPHTCVYKISTLDSYINITVKSYKCCPRYINVGVDVLIYKCQHRFKSATIDL